jgi:hypothetical protein
MRANAVVGGLLLVLGLTVPVAAQTSDVALAIHEDEAAGRAMGGPSMQGGVASVDGSSAPGMGRCGGAARSSAWSSAIGRSWD